MLKNKSNNDSFILIKKNSCSSFTLIELLVVITIIVIIGAIIFASTADARKQARDAQRIQNTKNLAQALELYYSDYWQYPAGEIGSSSDDGFCIELTLQDDGKTCKPNSFCSLITQKDQDGKVKYLASLPKDPLFDKNQCSVSPFSDNCHCILYKTKGDQEYKLFSKLEDENNDLAKNDGGTEPTMYEIASYENQGAIKEITYGYPWYYASSWPKRKKITINHSKVSSTLSDFPVLINISSDSDLASHAQSDGDDILFTLSDGTTKLSHEIENYDSSTGKLVSWVKVPTLSSTQDTILYLYYGNPSAENQENKTDVWDSNYKMVQHLKDNTTSTTKDSTSNNNNGTKKAVNEPIETDGKIGKAQSFDGSNDYINCGNNASLNITDNITIEAWVNPSANGWKYKRPITLSSPTSVANYQVKVELNSSNFNYSHAKSDGSDLRFYQSDGAKLDYWIEKWNTSGTSTVWVEVATSGTSVIYMYYGNPSASSESNGNNTFEFFDDFEGTSLDINKWTQQNSSGGSLSIKNSQITFKNAGSSDYIWIYSNTQFIYPVWIEGKMDSFNSYGATLRFGESTGTTLRSNGNYYNDYSVDVYGGSYRIVGDNSSRGWTVTSVTVSGATSGIWSFVWKTTGSQIFNLNYTSKLTGSDNTNTIGNYYLYLGNAMYSAGTSIADWVRVRKYTSSEPTATIGNETAAGISKAGAYGIGANTSTAFASINNQMISDSTSSGWNHVMLTYNKNKIKLYINGAQAATGDYSTAISINTNDLLIGDLIAFNGLIDEVRISNVARSPEWIATEYANQNDPASFYTIGQEENY